MVVRLGEYPVGALFANVENGALCALMIDMQLPEGTAIESTEQLSATDKTVCEEVKRWLESYFAGRILPPDGIALDLHGSAFQRMVWDELKKIPARETTTYGAIAKEIERKTGKRMSAQAVGGAVGKNPVSILLPCHRVIGADGSLTGYTGGIDKKTWLLRHEGFCIENGKIVQQR